MEYTLRISEDGLYVIITTTGSLTNESSLEQTTVVKEFARKYKLNKLFYDMVDCRYTGSIIGHYTYANDLMTASEHISRADRVVILVDQDDHSHDFLETVSKNNGFDVTIFRNREDAIRHLLRDL